MMATKSKAEVVADILSKMKLVDEDNNNISPIITQNANGDYVLRIERVTKNQGDFSELHYNFNIGIKTENFPAIVENSETHQPLPKEEQIYAKFTVTANLDRLYNDEDISFTISDDAFHELQNTTIVYPSNPGAPGSFNLHEKFSNYEGYYRGEDNSIPVNPSRVNDFVNYEKYFHNYGSSSRQLLTGSLFNSQTVKFYMNATVHKGNEKGEGTSINPYYETNNGSQVPNSSVYSLVLVDDLLGLDYEYDINYTGVQHKPFPLTYKDYRITGVTIPKGIFHNKAGNYTGTENIAIDLNSAYLNTENPALYPVDYEEDDGYPYEVFVVQCSEDGTESRWVSAGTGITDKSSSKYVSLPNHVTKVKIVVYEIDRSVDLTKGAGKAFEVDTQFFFADDDSRFELLLKSDSEFESSFARIVNYSYMQTLYKDEIKGIVDFAALKGSNGLTNNVNQQANYNSHLDTLASKLQSCDAAVGLPELPERQYPQRAYSNVHLRTTTTKLAAQTSSLNNGILKLSTINNIPDISFGDEYKDIELYTGTARSYGSLQCENPVTMKQFSVVAQLPKYLELPVNEYGEPDKQKIFDSIKFNSQYFSGNSAQIIPITETGLKLGENVFIETTKNADGTTLIQVKFDFSVGTPLLASVLTSVTFDYDVMVYADNDELDVNTFKVNTYTLLTDTGKRTDVNDSISNAGWAVNDNFDFDGNGISSSQTIVSNNTNLSLGPYNIDIQTLNHKHVKTYYTNSGYVLNSYVNARIENATSEKSEYTYRLHFGVTVSKEDTLDYAYMYDEIEQYRQDSNVNNTVNTQWQGTLQSVDVSDIINQRAAHGVTNVHPKVYYTTEVPYTPPPKDNPSRVLDYLTANGSNWHLMSFADGRIWSPPETKDVYAIMVELISNTSDNPKMERLVQRYEGTFQTKVYVKMLAPEGTQQNLRKLARNQYTAIYKMEQLEDDTFKDSEITSILLVNNLRIKKVDFENPLKGLRGASFDVYTATGSTLVYAARNTRSDDDTQYVEQPLSNIPTNSNGLLELSLAAGTYYICENTPPTYYELNSTLYKIEFSQDGKANLISTYKRCTQSEADLTFSDSGTTLYFKEDAEKDESMIDTSDKDNGLISVKDKMNLKGNAVFTKADNTTLATSFSTSTYELTDENRNNFSEGTENIFTDNGDGTYTFSRNETIIGNDNVTVITNTRTVKYLSGAKYSLYEYNDGTLSENPTMLLKINSDYYYPDENIVTGTPTSEMETGSNGKISLKNLPLGTYVLREVKAPVGYQISGDREFNVSVENIDYDNGYMIDLTANGQLSGNDCDILYDEQIKSIIRLEKHDKESGAAIPGTTYRLYRVRDDVDFGTEAQKRLTLQLLLRNWSYYETRDLITNYLVDTEKNAKTDAGGVLRFYNLEFGTYVVIESRAAAGYKINTGYIYNDATYSWNLVYTPDTDDRKLGY